MLSVTPDTGAAPNSSAWMLKLQHLKINTVLILAANAQKKRAVFIFFKYSLHGLRAQNPLVLARLVVKISPRC